MAKCRTRNLISLYIIFYLTNRSSVQSTGNETTVYAPLGGGIYLSYRSSTRLGRYGMPCIHEWKALWEIKTLAFCPAGRENYYDCPSLLSPHNVHYREIQTLQPKSQSEREQQSTQFSLPVIAIGPE
jgi:hypothetical protein